MRERPGIVLVPEWHVEESARSRHFDIRSDDRLPTADRGPHRFSEHRVDAGTAMLHFAANADDSTLAVGDGGSVEQLHQFWHESLAEHRTGLKQRSQIFDEFASERVPNNRHSHGPRSWPCSLNAKLGENGLTS